MYLIAWILVAITTIYYSINGTENQCDLLIKYPRVQIYFHKLFYCYCISLAFFLALA